ncbi:TonB-dependent receptor [Niabella ginsengisoli]|uniref:TonB-dependent receptor plug domain-containing protein n=1 Tax=Niabella ginsengisoli TaxID=522298 RepID=A0ABS9SMB2_9BACT|nr:TonB-dependent receptor [Niabella ginsengisoli]MCH5599426.1 TonB-dependent receptor plug domain-containing protein [Niabella ginsengisoli]
MFTSFRIYLSDIVPVRRGGSLPSSFCTNLIRLVAALCLLIIPAFALSQQMPQDTVKALSEVTVQAFGQHRTQATAIVTTIDYTSRSNKMSLVNDLNAVPGVRMEERSPGSYRINMRGSSLRSPFGVRNVKVYWNNLPFTDPGGNTYFNQLAFNNFSSIELFKGPVASMYGAGTGGLILINNDIKQNSSASLEYIGGSYNLQTVLASANWNVGRLSSKVTYAHNGSDGFREQSKLRRDNVSWTSVFNINKKQKLSASLLSTDMYYQTPGALTLKEFEANPRAARPAAGTFPSAMDARAAIFQKNFLAGITYTNNISSVFSNVTSIYGAYTSLKNSAVRNYETRNEPHFGGRTAFRFNKKLNETFSIDWNTGAEVQQGNFNIAVRGNRNGQPDTLQTNDDVNTLLYNLFTQATLSQSSKWFYTAGIGYNKSRLKFNRLSDTPGLQQPFAFSSELAPRFTVMRKFSNDLSLLASVAKGFSPPTVAELLPSTGVINTNLNAERGWNYELTIRKYLLSSKLYMEATGFYFDLENALVQLRDETGADYFVNAGRNRQKGLELSASYIFLPTEQSFIKYGSVKGGYSYNNFMYKYFSGVNGDFSGNRLPGVPRSTLALATDMHFKRGIYINSTYYGASSIFLNDANTVSAKPYHLITAKLGYDFCIKKIGLNLYVGADNLLNENYSLGNDINAVGGRFYNAALRRNYYAGAVIQFGQKAKLL